VNDFLRRYTLASWIIALTFFINAIVDAATNAWPFFYGSAEWRFGAAGIFSNYLITMLFGLLMMAAIGVAKQQQKALRVVGATAGLMTLVLLAGSIGYVLDTFQVRPAVREDQFDMYRIGAVKTAFKIGCTLLGTIALTLASFKAARDATAH